MQSQNVNDILKNIALLPTDDQCYIADTLNKRIHDLRRSQIAARGKQAQDNYDQSSVTLGTVADLMGAVEDD